MESRLVGQEGKILDNLHTSPKHLEFTMKTNWVLETGRFLTEEGK